MVQLKESFSTNSSHSLIITDFANPSRGVYELFDQLHNINQNEKNEVSGIGGIVTIALSAIAYFSASYIYASVAVLFAWTTWTEVRAKQESIDNIRQKIIDLNLPIKIERHDFFGWQLYKS